MAEIEKPAGLRRTILVIEEDDGARPYLTRNLRLFGFRLLVATTLEDAIEWLSGDTHIHADLLLLDLLGKQPEESLAMGRRLRCKAGYPCEVPVVVMPETVAKDVEGTDEKAGPNDWICHYEDSDQLHRLLVRLLQ